MLQLASERLFLVNSYIRLECVGLLPRRGCFSITPRWLEGAQRPTAFVGWETGTDRLVGDHAARLYRQYRDMVSDQAELRHVKPHEGRCQLSLTRPIVGLMRNSLSEASTVLDEEQDYELGGDHAHEHGEGVDGGVADGGSVVVGYLVTVGQRGRVGI